MKTYKLLGADGHIYDMKPDFADYEWECEWGGEDGIYLSVFQKTNIASKRGVEKCGGILFGTEDSVFTKTMDAMAKTRGGKLPELDDKDKMIEKMNEGRDSVLVYNMP